MTTTDYNMEKLTFEMKSIKIELLEDKIKRLCYLCYDGSIDDIICLVEKIKKDIPLSLHRKYKNIFEDPLAVAAGQNRFNVVSYLINEGATKQLESVVSACSEGHVKMVLFLLSTFEGKYINEDDMWIEAIENSLKYPEIVRILLERAPEKYLSDRDILNIIDSHDSLLIEDMQIKQSITLLREYVENY